MKPLIRWEGGTDPGLVRARNEDAWGGSLLEARGPGAVLAIADGMGGHPGGDVAARVAVEEVLSLASERANEADARSLLHELFLHVQAALARSVQEDHAPRDMGTTLTVLLVREDGAWVGHIGDTRLAWQRGDEICLVTADHTLAWELVEAGILEPDQAELAPTGSVLTRYLGAEVAPRPDVLDRPLALERGDRLLLATDGLGKVLPMASVAAALRGRTPRAAAQTLIQKVLAGGAPDNVTVLLADVEQAPAPSGPLLDWGEPRFRWFATD